MDMFASAAGNFANQFARKAAAFFDRRLKKVAKTVDDVADQAYRTVEQEINALPGRRYFFTPQQQMTFTTAATFQGVESPTVLTFKLPLDGPFVMTHYPLVTALGLVGDAAQAGRWFPVGTWPLPDNADASPAGPPLSRVDVSLAFQDQGTGGRFFESHPNLRVASLPTNQVLRQVPGGAFSRPGLLKRLPVPTIFPPKTVVTCVPRFDSIFFDDLETARLVVVLPGYKIANK